jgi:membrane protein implicated in regulation of membrane protease activity
MSFSVAVLWFIAGIALCALEVVFPTAFVEFTMGIGAIAVGLLLLAFPSLSFGFQAAIWAVISISLTVLARRFIPQGKAYQIEDAVEAKTITAIPARETGRVLYEGNSWAAQCGDEELAIAPNQTVYVVGRKGNTLIVMPENSVRNLR